MDHKKLLAICLGVDIDYHSIHKFSINCNNDKCKLQIELTDNFIEF